MKQKAPTIYDVAKAAGVSHQTVSRYLRGNTRVRGETQEKIAAALQQLGYRTNIMARNLRRGTSEIIELAIPTLNQAYFAELAQDIIDEARNQSLTVFVETTEGLREQETAVLHRFHRNFADGVIFFPHTITEEDLAGARVRFPLVFLGDRIPYEGFSHIVMPNEAGAQTAVRHLIERGRRRIALIGVEPHPGSGAARLRLAGYRRALEEGGLPFDDQLVVYSPDGWTRSGGVSGAEMLLGRGVAFDAVFAFNDALALGAMRGLLRTGLRIPHDVAVVGFDDTLDARYATPSLTSVSPNRKRIATLAVRILKDNMSRSGALDPQRLETDIELVVRESSG